MRKHLVWAVGLAIGALVACDDGSTIAGLGSTAGDTVALTVLPSDLQMAVGSQAQLATNAGGSAALQWLSSNNAVATVSGTGLVSAIAAGAATVTVRFAGDTANFAASTITVVPR